MVKKELTEVQHWQMVALQAQMQEKQRTMELAQEAAGHLHTRLGIATKASDRAKQERDMMRVVFKTEFIRLGHTLGAIGGPDTWKIHLEDNPKKSTLEWKDKPEKDKAGTQPVKEGEKQKP